MKYEVYFTRKQYEIRTLIIEVEAEDNEIAIENARAELDSGYYDGDWNLADDWADDPELHYAKPMIPETVEEMRQYPQWYCDIWKDQLARDYDPMYRITSDVNDLIHPCHIADYRIIAAAFPQIFAANLPVAREIMNFRRQQGIAQERSEKLYLAARMTLAHAIQKVAR